jgi:hypothetical protein
MASKARQFVNERSQDLADRARRLRTAPVEIARSAALRSAERIQSLKDPVRALSRSGVRLTAISQSTAQSLIELQAEIVDSVLSNAAAQLERAAQTESVMDLARDQADVLRATREPKPTALLLERPSDSGRRRLDRSRRRKKRFARSSARRERPPREGARREPGKSVILLVDRGRRRTASAATRREWGNRLELRTARWRSTASRSRCTSPYPSAGRRRSPARRRNRHVRRGSHKLPFPCPRRTTDHSGRSPPAVAHWPADAVAG